MSRPQLMPQGNGSGEGFGSDTWIAPTFTSSDIKSNFIAVLLHPGKPLHLCGGGRVACIHGNVCINGYTFKGTDFNEDKMVPFCSPFRVQGTMHCKTHRASFEQIDDEMLTRRLDALKFNTPAIMTYMHCQQYWGVLIIGPPPPLYSSIETVVNSDFLRPPPQGHPFQNITPTCYQLRNGGHLFAGERYDEVKEYINCVIKEYSKSKLYITMSLGSKNTGKSTFNKFVINKLLTHFERPEVNGIKPNIYFLDLDVGQSEFQPTGLVGIHKIDRPLLSVSYLSQSPSFSSAVYYGGTTPEIDFKSYELVVEEVMTELKRITQSVEHSIVIVNNLGWVDFIGEEIMKFVLKTTRPKRVVTFPTPKKSFDFSSLDSGLRIDVHQIAPYAFHDNQNRLAASTIRDYSLTAYLTQTFQLNHGLMLDSFNKCTVRVIPFNKIDVFFHAESLVDDRLIFNTLNTATVALCSPMKENVNSFKKTLIRNRADLPNKLVPVPGERALLRCYGFAFIRTISLDERAFYVITPCSSEVLKNVTVMAFGYQICTPKHIFQAQSTPGGPYLMTIGGDRDLNQLSMPIKVVSCSKRR